MLKLLTVAVIRNILSALMQCKRKCRKNKQIKKNQSSVVISDTKTIHLQNIMFTTCTLRKKVR